MAGRWSVSGALRCSDPVLRSWLEDRSSLTARCVRACRQFRIRLLSFRRESSLHDRQRGRRWVREVLLECDGRPVIFAHTELILNQRGRLRGWLAGLGSCSLGSLLFSRPGFVRHAIEVRRLDSREPLFRRAVTAAGLNGCGELWARRSLHSMDGQGVLVTEVFLPVLPGDNGGLAPMKRGTARVSGV